MYWEVTAPSFPPAWEALNQVGGRWGAPMWGTPSLLTPSLLTHFTPLISPSERIESPGGTRAPETPVDPALLRPQQQYRHRHPLGSVPPSRVHRPPAFPPQGFLRGEREWRGERRGAPEPRELPGRRGGQQSVRDAGRVRLCPGDGGGQLHGGGYQPRPSRLLVRPPGGRSAQQRAGRALRFHLGPQHLPRRAHGYWQRY